MADPDGRRLVRRVKPGLPTSVKSKRAFSELSDRMRLLFAFIPFFFLIVAIGLSLISSYNNYFSGLTESYVITIVSAVLFIGFELISGINGKLIIDVKQSIELRYAYRGLFMANIFSK